MMDRLVESLQQKYLVRVYGMRGDTSLQQDIRFHMSRSNACYLILTSNRATVAMPTAAAFLFHIADLIGIDARSQKPLPPELLSWRDQVILGACIMRSA